MSRGLRLIPIVLLVWLVIGLASQMVERSVPQFALAPAVNSKPGLNSADLVSGQPRLVNIFASWCVPCIGEAPVLAELRRRGVSIDGIAVRDTPNALNAFLARNGDAFERIGSDRQSEVQIAFGSSGVPETFLIDGKGVIRRQYIGPLNASNIPGMVRELEQAR